MSLSQFKGKVMTLQSFVLYILNFPLTLMRMEGCQHGWHRAGQMLPCGRSCWKQMLTEVTEVMMEINVVDGITTNLSGC